MAQLNACPACDGFLPQQQQSCPHCGEAVTGLSVGTRRGVWKSSGPAQKLLRGAIMFSSSGAFAMTLMACYGVPPCEIGNDNDGDGWDDVCSFDCDDTDPTINPGAIDATVDGVDQNCDGVDGPIVIEGPDGGEEEDAGDTCVDEDIDRDDYTTCNSNGLGVDCDDEDSRVHPGAVDDAVDGTDDNCDGVDGDMAPADAGLVMDAGPADTDGGAAADAGSPDADGGSVEEDAGLPPADAGNEQDGGTVPDAGA